MYAPSSFLKGKGSIAVGTFRYVPAEQGFVDRNEFQKAPASIDDIYLSEPIADVVRNALRMELISAGYTLQAKAGLVIEADIQRFLYQFGIAEDNFFLDVTFRILRNDSLTLTYAASSQKKAPKSLHLDTDPVRSALASCLADFLAHARAKRIL